MRFMMLMIPNITEDNWGPSPEAAAAMGGFNEELAKAGKLIALDGLHPTGEGARVSFAAGGKATAVDGPFTEAKEVVGGYWVIEADSRQEAVDWASRCPAGEGDVIEVRRIYEMTDFAADVQEAANTDLL
jgi:hypothetical protein